MKTKFIVASTLGLLGITSMVVGTVTLAGNTKNEGQTSRMSSGATMRMGSGNHMITSGTMMKQFTSTGAAEAFRTTTQLAITNNDYTAYVAAHTKNSITTYMTQTEFTTMVAQRAKHEKSLAALKSGDYATWKTLNTDNQLLTTIDTETKFKKFQEIESYREKINELGTELGIESGRGEGIDMGMGNGNDKMEMERGMGKGMGRGINPANGSGNSQ